MWFLPRHRFDLLVGSWDDSTSPAGQTSCCTTQRMKYSPNATAIWIPPSLFTAAVSVLVMRREKVFSEHFLPSSLEYSVVLSKLCALFPALPP